MQTASWPLPVAPEVIATFCRRNRIVYLGLFGSAVRGEIGPGSDYDLLVEFDGAGQIGLLAYARVQRELAALLGRRVELVSRRGLKPAIRSDVLQSTVDFFAGHQD